jgi:hypothetical protein
VITPVEELREHTLVETVLKVIDPSPLYVLVVGETVELITKIPEFEFGYSRTILGVARVI